MDDEPIVMNMKYVKPWVERPDWMNDVQDIEQRMIEPYLHLDLNIPQKDRNSRGKDRTEISPAEKSSKEDQVPLPITSPKVGDLVDVLVKGKWYCGTIKNINPDTKRIMAKTINSKIPIHWRVYSGHRTCVCKTRDSKGIPILPIDLTDSRGSNSKNMMTQSVTEQGFPSGHTVPYPPRISHGHIDPFLNSVRYPTGYSSLDVDQRSYPCYILIK
jgi:hypothetical protein